MRYRLQPCIFDTMSNPPKMSLFKPAGTKAPKVLGGVPLKINAVKAPPMPRVPSGRMLDAETKSAIDHVTKLHKY